MGITAGIGCCVLIVAIVALILVWFGRDWFGQPQAPPPEEQTPQEPSGGP